MQPHFLIILFLVSFASLASAVSDENICAEECDFCCREKVCRSKEDCEGNFSPFIILGAVAGGIIGLLVLRRLYVYLRGKNPKPKEGAGKKERRTRTRAAKPKKEKPVKSGRMRTKEDKPRNPDEVYLQIDNESIVGGDNKADQEQSKSPSLLPDKKSSKNEISSKSRLEADDKANTHRSEKKRESSAPRSKTPNKSSGTVKSGTSSSKQSSKKPAAGAKSGSSKPGSTGERGRSANSGRKTEKEKERASSQPKKSGGTNGNNDKKPLKKNQV